MLLVNPRRRRVTKRRRTTARRRTNPRPSKAKRSAAARKGARTRARNKARRSRAAKKGARKRKRNPAKRRASSRRRAPARRRRRNPIRRRATSRRRNPARRRSRRRRRRNPSGNGMFGGLAKTLKGIPIIGPVLAGAVGVIPSAALGAISVEPTMWLAGFVGPWLPAGIGSSWLYAGSGLLFAGIAKAWLPGFIGKKWANDLSVAAAAAGAGVAYYKMRMGDDADIATEVGMLELHGVGFGALTMDFSGPGASYSDGMAYTVEPFPGAAGYGALVVGN